MVWKVEVIDGYGDAETFEFLTEDHLDYFTEGFYAVKRNDDAYIVEESIREENE